MQRLWLAGAVGTFLALLGGSASADISRVSEGKLVFRNTSFQAEDGTQLGSISVGVAPNYVTAIGRYGGGDTASGRMKAKIRAGNKTFLCMGAFFAWGLLGRNSLGVYPWGRDCGRDPNGDYSKIVDPDITLRSDWYAYFTIEDLASSVFCERARQLAQQRGKSGPVTVSGSVEAFSDGAGTEADRTDQLGVHYTQCY